VQKTPTNIFTYVDDIVVARKKKSAYISNLEKTFTNMREFMNNSNKASAIEKRHSEINWQNSSFEHIHN
jgi:hypothetical protein